MAQEIDHLGWRGRVGLILPSVNTVVEPVFFSLAPRGLSFHASRTFISGTSKEDVLKMDGEKSRAVRELASIRPQCIVDCCTAGGVIQGLAYDGQFCAEIKNHYGIDAISSVQSIVKALSQYNLKRLVVVTPYPREVDELEQAFFEQNGFQVAAIKGLGIKEGAALAAVSADQIYDLCLSAWQKDADGVLISCMNFNAMPVIQALELALRVPVISSVSATLWGVLKQLGIDDSIYGCGRLLEGK